MDLGDRKAGAVFGGLSSETRNQCLGYDIAPHLLNMMCAKVRTVPYRLSKSRRPAALQNAAREIYEEERYRKLLGRDAVQIRRQKEKESKSDESEPERKMMPVLDTDQLRAMMPAADQIVNENRKRAKSLIKIDTDERTYVNHSTLMRPKTGKSDTRNSDLRNMNLMQL